MPCIGIFAIGFISCRPHRRRCRRSLVVAAISTSVAAGISQSTSSSISKLGGFAQIRRSGSPSLVGAVVNAPNCLQPDRLETCSGTLGRLRASGPVHHLGERGHRPAGRDDRCGGGGLMTPMLILLFGVTPAAAISSDLVAAVVMRPVGAAVHLRKGTVNLRLVGWMVLGSVPMVFVGAYLLHRLGDSSSAQKHIETVLGAASLVGAAAMVLRFGFDRRGGNARRAKVGELMVRPFRTVAIGMIGGLLVGMTSVGSGSLMIVLLLFLYPTIGAKPAGRHRPDPSGAAYSCGGAWRSCVRPYRVRGHHLVDYRKRPRGPGRIVPVIARPGSLHQAGHHLRDLRVRPEIRRGRDPPCSAGSSAPFSR